MNKQDVVEKVRELGLTRDQAAKAVDTVLDTITESLKAGDGVQFTGFGQFVVVDKPARTARNPKTGEAVKVPAKRVVKFRAGTGLKL